MDIKDVPEDIRKRAEACKTPEEMLELAKKEGYELSDDELEAVSGGMEWCNAYDKPCEQYVRRWCPKLCPQEA